MRGGSIFDFLIFFQLESLADQRTKEGMKAHSLILVCRNTEIPRGTRDTEASNT